MTSTEVIPSVIDDHMKLFGKEPWDVDYNSVGYCVICNSRVDEYDYCGCGGRAD